MLPSWLEARGHNMPSWITLTLTFSNYWIPTRRGLEKCQVLFDIGKTF